MENKTAEEVYILLCPFPKPSTCPCRVSQQIKERGIQIEGYHADGLLRVSENNPNDMTGLDSPFERKKEKTCTMLLLISR